ncbi:MAG: hypothetical protein ACOCZH_00080 [Phototrophicaceae bacterium]
MGKQERKMLKSKDVDERKRAVRAVARAVDKSALRQLAFMAGDDPDKEVRRLARAAGIYIRQQLGEIPDKVDENGEPVSVNVDDRTAALAQRYLEVAMSANMAGERARVLKLLSKAISLNPNLRDEPYFVSLAEQATRLDGPAAIEAVNDAQRLQETERQEVEQRRRSAASEHQATISQANWRDVLFDLSMVAVISFIGTVIAMFIAVQTAQNYHARYEANQEAVVQAEFDGRYARDRDGNIIYADDFQNYPVYVEYLPENQLDKPPTFSDMSRTYYEGTPYWDTNAYWREVGPLTILLRGAMAAIVVPLLLLLLAGVAHLLAGRILRGDGRLEYYGHRIGALMTNRVLIFFAICGVGALLYFGSGSGLELVLFALAGYSALVAFQIISITGSAYQLGLARGAVAASTGLILAAALGTGSMLVL